MNRKTIEKLTKSSGNPVAITLLELETPSLADITNHLKKILHPNDSADIDFHSFTISKINAVATIIDPQKNYKNAIEGAVAYAKGLTFEDAVRSASALLSMPTLNEFEVVYSDFNASTQEWQAWVLGIKA